MPCSTNTLNTGAETLEAGATRIADGLDRTQQTAENVQSGLDFVMDAVSDPTAMAKKLCRYNTRYINMQHEFWPGWRIVYCHC